MTAYLREFLIWTFFLALPLLIAVILAHICLAAPARRNERARLFLDLLETALQTGQSPERVIVSVSETHDPMVSAHFHLLAARIEEGARLHEALEIAPRLLPPGVGEVIKIGASEQTLPRLIPAARAMLGDSVARMRGAVNYLLVFLIVLIPALLLYYPFFAIWIWPRIRQTFESMEIPPPLFTIVVFENFGVAVALQMLMLLILALFAFFYVSGPRGFGWLRLPLNAWPDRLILLLPWRRRRAQRDFTAVLAVLLDAGLDEFRAVELAARATANIIFQRRAARVVERLREGVALPEALRYIEPSKEFQWRWQNALRAGKGFFAALRGWHESLEARAFQQEQAAAHVITSLIVVVNGALVAIVASAAFLIIIQFIEEVALW